MARWKLINAHYLNCPGTEWEYNETNRTTGQQVRKRYPVPRLLHPDDPTCWTVREGPRGAETGDIVVCHEGKGQPNDIIFIGDPTPDMIPLDDEATAITASFAEHWRYKPEDSSQTFSQSMIDKFQMEQAALQAKPQSVEVEGMKDLLLALTVATTQNAEMIKHLLSQQPRKL
jgi:hypothetical protein